MSKFDFLTTELVREAANSLDVGSIPIQKKGKLYEVNIDGTTYPFKELVREAAKIAEVTIEKFGSSDQNRTVFEDLTGFKCKEIFQNDVHFNSFKELVDHVNEDLKDFSSRFQYRRKELFGNKRASATDRLFELKEQGRDWAINSGGGTELQYHLYFRDTEVGYGLGFNTQYVPFANKKSPQDYMRPFAESFLSLPDLESTLLDSGFNYIAGKRENLRELKYDNYILIGKCREVEESAAPFKLDSHFYSQMIEDIKGILYQSYQKIILNIETLNTLTSMIELLKYKKQIILQGPPGTGKTREAKRLARELTAITDLSQVDHKDIRECFRPGQVIPMKEGKSTFQIVEINQYENFQLEVGEKKPYSVSVDQIIAADGERTYTGRSYAKAMADYAKKELFKDRVDLVQFHPSYTYEDFVRGITVKSAEGGIEYKTENKIFGEIIKKANENLQLSKTSKNDEALHNQWLDEVFDSFISSQADLIEEDEQIPITEKVAIVGIEEDAFRYKGKSGWSEKGNRMTFNDIKQAYLDGNEERQDIRRNKKLSGLANWHASYYIRMVNKFKEYLKENQLTYELSDEPTERLKNYVLIIDEINRANLPSVLGELIYALEYRGKPVKSMYAIGGKSEITIPENLYIIGTMNTADRSVGHIDYAIQRRFAFVEMLPRELNEADLDKGQSFKSEEFHQIQTLFKNHVSSEFEDRIQDVQIGHSYFIHDSKKVDDFNIRLKYEVAPILEEYVKDGILKNDEEVKRIIDKYKA